MMQALASEWGDRFDVVDSHLTSIQAPKRPRRANIPATPAPDEPG